jgi:hypothetical protein
MQQAALHVGESKRHHSNYFTDTIIKPSIVLTSCIGALLHACEWPPTIAQQNSDNVLRTQLLHAAAEILPTLSSSTGSTSLPTPLKRMHSPHTCTTLGE